MAHSSRGLGHLPLKEEITGSNPVCATNKAKLAMDVGPGATTELVTDNVLVTELPPKEAARGYLISLKVSSYSNTFPVFLKCYGLFTLLSLGKMMI